LFRLFRAEFLSVSRSSPGMGIRALPAAGAISHAMLHPAPREVLAFPCK
jgi:hypothetical protein